MTATGNPVESPVRVGMVGLGPHAQAVLIPSLLESPLAQLVAVCDPVTSLSEGIQRRLPSIATAKTIDEMLDPARAVEAVIVAAPPSVHAEVAIKAIEHGRAVFVEKPPANSLAELRHLADASAKHAITTAVGHNMRHSPAWRAVKDTASRDGFGELAAVRLSYWASQPRGPRWGMESVARAFLLSHAVHAVDLLVDLLGEIELTSCQFLMAKDGGCVLNAQLRASHGALIQLCVSNIAPRFEVSLEALSTNSQSIRLAFPRRVEWCGSSESSRWSSVWEPRGLEGLHVLGGYQQEIGDFLRRVRSKCPGQPSFSDECQNYQILEKVLSQV